MSKVNENKNMMITFWGYFRTLPQPNVFSNLIFLGQCPNGTKDTG